MKQGYICFPSKLQRSVLKACMRNKCKTQKVSVRGKTAALLIGRESVRAPVLSQGVLRNAAAVASLSSSSRTHLRRFSMASVKIMGGQVYLASLLRKYGVEARGGHTVIEYDVDKEEAVAQAQEIVRNLTSGARFTMLETTTTYPSRVSEIDPTKPEAEYTLIPAIAGGMV